ncbi:MAG: hypothetical protein IJL87_05715 [Clostridia bacterium]|nr:hypothetical protein [Clostridia bacterium]
MKKILLLLAAAAALFLLASCDIKTTVTADKNFCGERVMEVTVLKNEIESEYVFGTPADVEKVLRKEMPEELTMDVKAGKNGSYTYTFTMEFENYDDYLTKVTNLLGEEPEVKYNYSGTPFSRGFMLKEDFSSADLLGWAKNALIQSGIFKRFEYAQLNFTETTAVIDGSKLNTSDSTRETLKVSLSKEAKIKSIDISTVKEDFYNFRRTVTYTFPQSAIDFVGKKEFEKFMKGLEPENGRVEITYPGEGSDSSDTIVRVEFTSDTENLGVRTNSALNAQNNVVKYTFLEDGLTPFTGRWELYEYVDLAGWEGVNGNLLGPVTLWYKTEDGSRLTESNATVGIAALEGKITNNGRIIEYSGLTNDVLRINMKAEYNFSLEHVRISVAENNNDHFTKKYTLVYATTEDAAYGPKFTSAYLTLKGMDDYASFRSDISEDGLGRLSIEMSGSSKRVTNACRAIFGEGNGILQNVDEKSKFTLTLQNNITDGNNLSKFLEKSGYNGTVSYSLRPYAGNRIYNAVVTDASGNVIRTMDKEVSNTGRMTAEIDSFQFSCGYSSLGENKWLIVFACLAGALAALGLILVIAADHKNTKKRKKSKE